MTLPELCDYTENSDNTMAPNSLSSEQIGLALKAMLQQAASQGRITCSLMSCVDLLSSTPDDVMLCVMPLLSHPDAAATIQSTLIRAVCEEHSIRVLSVDCDVKLAKVVYEEEKGEVVDNNCNMIISDCDNVAPVMGFPCVLVQYPKDGASAEDEMVAEYCKEQLYGDNGKEPYIELPD